MTRSRSGAAVLLVATFVLGGLVGGAATTVADHRRPDPHHGRPSFIDRLSGDLDLTANQRDSIQMVMDRHQPAMDSLWALIRPQFSAERQAIRNEISALLTKDQQARYLELQRQDSVRRAEGDRSRNGRR